MVWSQIFPFVVLQLLGDSKADSEQGTELTATRVSVISGYLTCSFVARVILNIVFFCTIDLRYIWTFFSTKTAPQYTCDCFRSGTDDVHKFSAVFSNRNEYTHSIREEVKEWVCENIAVWTDEKPAWFNIELIDDEYFPRSVLQSIGGKSRRRKISTGLALMLLDASSERSVATARKKRQTLLGSIAVHPEEFMKQ